MPAVHQNNRNRIKLLGVEACEDVGDICFVFFIHFLKSWKDETRWRTAHRRYKELVLQPEASEYFNCVYEKLMHKFELDDCVAALELAWQVFFIKYVWPYEIKKFEDNGEILID